MAEAKPKHLVIEQENCVFTFETQGTPDPKSESHNRKQHKKQHKISKIRKNMFTFMLYTYTFIDEGLNLSWLMENTENGFTLEILLKIEHEKIQPFGLERNFLVELKKHEHASEKFYEIGYEILNTIIEINNFITMINESSEVRKVM